MTLTKRRRALMVTATNGSPHGKCGPYAYWLIKDGVLTIRGTGEMYYDVPQHYTPEFPPPWDNYKDEIKEICVMDGITRISGYAFYKLSSVEKVTIPQSVTYVGAYAFADCSSLEDVYFYMKSGEVYFWAFQNCDARKRIYINSITDYCNTKLDQLTYPAGTDLFVNGRKITDLVIPSGAKTTNAFGGISLETVFIPKNVEVYVSAFEKCLSLRSVTFENGSAITSIPAFAFRACPHLVSVNVPDTVETIAGGAFSHCPLLQMNRLPLAIKSITSNQYGAFQDSGSITISSLPDCITDIPMGIFSRCTNVSISTFPPHITSIGGHALCATAATVNRIPADVTSIGRRCLAENITELYFDGTPASINLYAFENLSNLRDIYVPWAPGAVANAPWSALNATIHYNS